MPPSATIDWTGGVLVAGLGVFLTGAAFWKPAVYQQALPQALAAMDREPNRLRWIQSWMIAGVATTTLGVMLLAREIDLHGEHFWSTLGAACFALGVAPMLVSLAFGLTVRIWAAAETTATGEVPRGFEAFDRFAGLLYAIHMFTAYASWACLGAAILRSHIAPPWLGWSGVAAGCIGALGFAALRGGPLGPPFLAHVYPAAIGIGLLLRA
jgi:hypothetical protein